MDMAGNNNDTVKCVQNLIIDFLNLIRSITRIIEILYLDFKNEKIIEY
jgi:hypothetical protein